MASNTGRVNCFFFSSQRQFANKGMVVNSFVQFSAYMLRVYLYSPLESTYCCVFKLTYKYGKTVGAT